MFAVVKCEDALFHTSDAAVEAEADARAEADVAAGRVISHDAVRKWLTSLTTENPLPRPRIGD